MRNRLSTGALARSPRDAPWLTIGAWLGARRRRRVPDRVLPRRRAHHRGRRHQHARVEGGRALIEERLPERRRRADEVLVVRFREHSVDDPAFRAHVDALLAQARALGATPTASYYADGDESLVSSDRDTIAVPLAVPTTPTRPSRASSRRSRRERRRRLRDRHHRAAHGRRSTSTTPPRKDLQRGEMFGIGIAPDRPARRLRRARRRARPDPARDRLDRRRAGPDRARRAGLRALVLRREHARDDGARGRHRLRALRRLPLPRGAGKGLEKLDAIAAAGGDGQPSGVLLRRHGRLALIGMFLVPSTIFRSLAVGAILVVLVSVAAALTLLPAVLGLLGDRVDALRLPFVGRRRRSEGGFWARIARVSCAGPWSASSPASRVLVALRPPVRGHQHRLRGRLDAPRTASSPSAASSSSTRSSATGRRPPRSSSTATSAPRRSGRRSSASRRDRRRRSLRAGPSSTINDAGDLAVMTVLLDGDDRLERGDEAVETLRDDYIPEAFAGVPAEVLVGGETAENVDFFAITDQYLPIVIAFVLGLSFLLLAVAFRSLVVPATSIVMNLLSVGAAYGLLVLVFQEGVGAGCSASSRSDDDRGLAPALPLHRPLRALDGLPRLPAQPDPRALRPDRRQHRIDRLRGQLDGADHHRRGADHGRGVRRLRGRRAGDVPADGLRPRRRRPPRRDDRPLGARAGDDAAARRPQLVPASPPPRGGGGGGGGWGGGGPTSTSSTAS